jgi:cellulose synthase/poly-beta-1,6-N-acetylglucosamine synthase-like glycosyltransferase
MFQFFHSLSFEHMMTPVIVFLFWIGLFVIFYTYVGYGLVIFLLSKFKNHSKAPIHVSDEDLPEVTLLVAAYNEEQCIEDKITNSLNLDYPKDKLSLFFVTDGSTDNTPDIVKKSHAVRLFHEPKRKGKIHAVNRVMKFVKTPIVVFSDANTLLNPPAIRKLVRHYQDPAVGGVAGEKQIYKNQEDNASGSGEGFYWKYESFLKKKDAEVYSIVGAAGELFSVRTDLFEEPAENIIIEDFYLSMRICAKGYRFMYEPEAIALETASVSVGEEWKRKVRICAGGFQAIARLKPLLNPFRFGMLSFQYISHRVLRWTLAPLFIPIVLLCNAWLALTSHPVYVLLFAGQVIFHLMAVFGYLLRDRRISVKGFFVPYYFMVMNLSVYAGFVRYVKGKQSVVWEKAQRASIAPQQIKS